MDRIDNLKLAIYESGLSDEDIEAMLEYVEEAVSWNTGEGPVNLNAGDALQLGIGAATTAAAIGYGAHAGSHGVKAYKINKKKIEQEEKLKDLCEKLKMAKDKSTQKDLESRIDKLQNDIRELDKQLAQLCVCVMVHTWSATSARWLAEWDDCTPTQLVSDGNG